MEADPETRLAKAEAIARAHPESPEAAVFLAAVLRDDGRERDVRAQAIARAVALAPDDPDAITADAVEKARTGRVDAALEAAGRAVAVAPWSPVVFRVQANLLAAVGRCEEALDRTRRAQEVLPHRAPPELVDAVQHDLELIRGKCSRAQAAARSCYRSRGPGSLRARLRPRQVLRRARRFR
jgi:Flp pilus assembly protein TadD